MGHLLPAKGVSIHPREKRCSSAKFRVVSARFVRYTHQPSSIWKTCAQRKHFSTLTLGLNTFIESHLLVSLGCDED